MSNPDPVVLGSGNFSTTFLKVENDQKFVLKKLKPKHRDNPKVIRLFENEELFIFDHPGLPNEIRYFEDYGDHFLVKPFVDGHSLEDLKKKLTAPQLRTILLELIDLLLFLEKEEIVHCDLKPSNILIDDDGKVNLLDFGLAQRIGDPKINFTLFSLGFSAPELILNRRQIIDQRTDIFSFGMLMYYLIEGKLPYTDSNPSHFTNLQITYPIPKGSKIQKDIWPIISKCLAKYQFEFPPNRYKDLELDKRLWDGMNQRYNNFSELKEDLQKLEEKAFKSKRFRF